MLLQEEIQANVKPTTNIQDAPISSSRKKNRCIKKTNPAEDLWKKPRFIQYI